MVTISPDRQAAQAAAAASTALLTDHYELTMLQASLRSGAAHRRSVFEVFARKLPDGRRYGVVAGTGRLLDAIAAFSFGDEQLAFLERTGVVDRATIDWLAQYRFRGAVRGYAEGETYFPHSPILEVEATFAEGVLLETLILSVLNHDSAIASAASRMTSAAAGRPCIEMGSRRTHEQAAVASARAAYLAGFASTSNLEAGYRYGVPTVGTSAHAFTLVHDTERDAFQAQLAALGKGTTLLVDTFDVAEAVRVAVEVAGADLGAVRLDSGDLLWMAHRVRRQLDQLGARDTKIVVTSDLDEYAIAALASAPVDAYGVGTQLVTGSGAPTAAMVYKLVARAASPGPDAPLVPVEKRSPDKPSRGGRKQACRRIDADGVATAEMIRIGAQPADPDSRRRDLIAPLMTNGEPVRRATLEEGRELHRRSLAELPISATQLSRGDAVIPTVYEYGDELEHEARDGWAR
ncbi:nicotinate phosphoribosyltransferase [Actinocrinis puniceicyclus]|uniref:Nicotinate phosphoribosyltransferase n=1 Tax=Actinocrinis puniceicyclus TaxID=977794 RepID=A0A8J8BBZ1_9ACTN|nr:nicotinate phosphoribosyltransferase [Actinocrinis puniceicyclus]MBS2964567.1 nicotinate phosphoribosyltransferase [Actinocrinis puniceicyclus]